MADGEDERLMVTTTLTKLQAFLPTECEAAQAAWRRLNPKDAGETDWLVVLDRLLDEEAEPDIEQGILQASHVTPAERATMIAPLYLTLLYANQGEVPALDEYAEALGKLALAAK